MVALRLREKVKLHDRCYEVYNGSLIHSVKTDLNGSDVVCLATLRSRHSVGLGASCVRISLSEVVCIVGAESESVGHIWKCAARELARRLRGCHQTHSDSDSI